MVSGVSSYNRKAAEHENRQNFEKVREDCGKIGGCPGVPVHEGIPFVFITIHGVMTQFVNVSFLCVPVHEDTTENRGKIKYL